MKWLNFLSAEFWLAMVDVRLSFGGGSSGGGGGSQVYDWNSTLKPYWAGADGDQGGALRTGLNLSNTPYAPYGGQVSTPGSSTPSPFGGVTTNPGFTSRPGQRIADISPDQQDAMGMMRHYIAEPNKSLYGIGNAGLQSTLMGNFLPGNPGGNPYADKTNPAASLSNPMSFATDPYVQRKQDVGGFFQAQNPWQSAAVQADVNPLLGKDFSNPYTGLGDNKNPYANPQINSGGQFQANPTNPGSNSYIGESPQFQSVLNKGLADITRNYQLGTSADTNRMFDQAGAFGGSAHQQAMDNNSRELGNALGNYSDQMRQQQYDRSAGLTESGLQRGLQAQTFDTGIGNQSFESAAQRALDAQKYGTGLGSQLYENALNRGYGSAESQIGRQFGGYQTQGSQDLAAQTTNKDIGSQTYENMLNRGYQGSEAGLNRANSNIQDQISRQFQSGENQLNRGNQDWTSERGNMMQAAPLSQADQGLTLQRYNTLMGLGDINRGYQQDVLNQGYNDWQAQRQYPYQQLDFLTGLLSRAQGGVGPNVQTQQTAYSPSPGSLLLGAGLLGSSLYGGRSG